MRQLLASWYDKSTLAIATWRGDTQRYWLTQVLDCARKRHDQWLHSTPSQRASLEPAYILGDRKHIPEAQNARCDSEVNCRCVRAARILHCRTDSLVCDEATHSTSWHQWSHHAEGNLNPSQSCSFYIRSRLCMARKDAASIESMHEDRSASASTNHNNLCSGSSQWHHPVLPHRWQYLGQSISQASVARIQSHSRESLCHACRVPHRA